MRLDTKMLHPCMNAGPIGEHDLPNTRINELLALDAFAAGAGTLTDVRVLMTAMRMARALVRLGHGGDAEQMQINLAGDALRRCGPQASGAIAPDDHDMQALRALVLLLDGQRAACGGSNYARALLRVGRECGR